MKWIVFCALFALTTTLPCAASGDMVSDEKESLRIRFEEKSRKCAEMKGAGNRASCSTKALNDYNAILSLLSENPDLYFQNKYGNSSTSAKWHGPAGYIRLKNGNLHTPDGKIYYQSSSSGTWHGPDGYIKQDGSGNLHTPGGTYYPSN